MTPPRPAPDDNLPLRAWLAAFRFLRWYSRYEVEGLEHLLAPGAALLAGYHGKPAAYDLCMLMTVIWDELGYMPHGIVHRFFRVQPQLRWLCDGVGLVTGDGEEIREAVARGEHVIVPPGGSREGYRSSLHKYEVRWGDRTGYLKLAIRHGMKVIPVAAIGVDDWFVGFNDGDALSKKVHMPHEVPLWLGFGMTGLFPFSLPFPVKITQLVGAPIDPLEDGPVDLDDRPRLLSIHRRVTGAVQALLDRNRRGEICVIPARILGTASALPGRSVSTDEVAARAFPDAPKGLVESKTGIRARHWADPGTRMIDVAADVLGRAVEAAGIDRGDLRRIIFVSSTGGDTLCPATASAIIDVMGVNRRCDGFDLSNACTGFLTAIDLAARSVATGLGPVGVVAVEITSRFLTPDEPRPYVILADAAGAVVIGAARENEGIRASDFGTDGSSGPTVIIRNPGVTGAFDPVRFVSSNQDMTRMATDAITGSVRAVLDAAGLSIGDVEWVLPHQPNGRMLAHIVATLGVDPARTVPVVEEIGSVAAASVAVSLDRLMRSGRVRPGDRILLTAVGSPIAWGTILYQTPGTENVRQ